MDKSKAKFHLGKLKSGFLILEVLSLSHYYQEGVNILTHASSELRKLAIENHTIIRDVIFTRPPFRVNSISQLLSPIVLNHSLRI